MSVNQEVGPLAFDRLRQNCIDPATIGREEVEERVLSGLKQRLLAPDLLAQFAEEYRKAFNEAAAGASHDRQKAEQSLKKVEGKIAGILSAIEYGTLSPIMQTGD